MMLQVYASTAQPGSGAPGVVLGGQSKALSTGSGTRIPERKAAELGFVHGTACFSRHRDTNRLIRVSYPWNLNEV
ncbi:hypothetical protein GCM10025778_08450 [Paeniglutamicibacter antarcticus]|uniref:Uncharacterized protein n=1 Tax=Paeniglutamicibacter antarcticus TaxID=494023 RepID=A0ABP9TMJ1_9MICC